MLFILFKNNLERSEFETRTMLNNRIEQLEKENVLVKRKLDQAQDSQRAHVQSLEVSSLVIAINNLYLSIYLYFYYTIYCNN